MCAERHKSPSRIRMGSARNEPDIHGQRNQTKTQSIGCRGCEAHFLALLCLSAHIAPLPVQKRTSDVGDMEEAQESAPTPSEAPRSRQSLGLIGAERVTSETIIRMAPRAEEKLSQRSKRSWDRFLYEAATSGESEVYISGHHGRGFGHTDLEEAAVAVGHRHPDGSWFRLG